MEDKLFASLLRTQQTNRSKKWYYRINLRQIAVFQQSASTSDCSLIKIAWGKGIPETTNNPLLPWDVQYGNWVESN